MKTRQPRTYRRTQAVVGGLALVVLAAGGLFLFARPYLRGSAQADGAPQPDATLRISMSGWQPAEVRAQAGQPVTIRMINLDNRFHTDGGGWHNFVVPFLGVEQRVGPEQTGTFTITAPLARGEYIFYCDICCGGKDNPYMRGKLLVS